MSLVDTAYSSQILFILTNNSVEGTVYLYFRNSLILKYFIVHSVFSCHSCLSFFRITLSFMDSYQIICTHSITPLLNFWVH